MVKSGMMAPLLIALCASFVLSASLTPEKLVFEEFQSFVKKYNKVYDSVEEFHKRFNIFLKNYHKVEAFKATAAKNGFEMDYQIGVTEFFDLSRVEFQKTYLNLDTTELKKLKSVSNTMKPTLEDVPESYDWREHSAVTEVKNQGSCGSCWAFSTTGNIEGQYMIKTGETKQFSEQQLVDCDTESDQGCNGGLMEYAFKYLIEKGAMTEEDYPYTGYQEQCKYDEEKATVKVAGFDFAGTEDEEEIKKILVEKGPLAIALNATPLQFYWGGIFDPWWQWVCPKSGVNHAVLLVGYGVEGEKNYWIVKNSWGKSWGESGYFRIVRGKEACGINTYVVSANLA